MKRLLLQFIALLCVTAGALAYEKDDYVFTGNARLKVIDGVEHAVNGSFGNKDSQSSAFGWTDIIGEPISSEGWLIEEGKGPNGENTLMSLTSAEGMSAYQKFPFESGQTYIISIKVKSTGSNTTSTSESSKNYIDVYANKDGSINKQAERFQQVASPSAITADWTELNFVFTDTVAGGSDGYLVIGLARLMAGTEVTGISVKRARKVFDTRIAEDAIKYARSLYNSGEFKNGVEDFGYEIMILEGALAFDGWTQEEVDDEVTMNSIVETLGVAQEEFLKQNTADMADYIDGWEKHGKASKFSSIGDWVMEGGRWHHTDPDPNVLHWQLPSTYDLDQNGTPAATLTKTLAPGRYMVSFDLKGLYYASSNKNETALNYNLPFNSARIFANGDSLSCPDLKNSRYTTHHIFFDVTDKENNVIVGTSFNTPEEMRGKKLGGFYYVNNFKLRMVGQTQTDLDKVAAIDYIRDQQYALEQMIVYTDSVYNLNRPWDRNVLADSINAAKTVYQASFDVIDKDGKFIGDESLLYEDDGKTVNPKPYYGESLATQVNYLRRARNTHIALNAPYVTLVADVKTCEEVHNDNSLSGDADRKTTLKQAIDEASAMIKGVTGTPDSLAFVEMDVKLMKACTSYKISAANYARPVYLDIVNANFQSQSIGTTTKNNADGITGWRFTAVNPNKEYFVTQEDALFENGTMARVSRGNTVSPNCQLVQQMTLEGGIYEYRATARAWNDNPAYDLGMATILFDENTMESDTIYNKSMVRLFFGNADTETDSVMIHSRNLCIYNNSVIDGEIPSKYSLFHYVNTGKAPSVQFGLSSFGQIDKAGSCYLAFGDNEMICYGTDLNTFFAGLKDETAAEIRTAETLISDTLTDRSLLEPGRVYVVKRLAKAIAAAKTSIDKATTSDATEMMKAANDMQNAKWAMMAAAKDFRGITSSIEGVLDNNGTTGNAPRGVFTLTGVKVASDAECLNDLAKGIYIVNGKKVIIK